MSCTLLPSHTLHLEWAARPKPKTHLVRRPLVPLLPFSKPCSGRRCCAPLRATPLPCLPPMFAPKGTACPAGCRPCRPRGCPPPHHGTLAASPAGPSARRALLTNGGRHGEGQGRQQGTPGNPAALPTAGSSQHHLYRDLGGVCKARWRARCCARGPRCVNGMTWPETA